MATVNFIPCKKQNAFSMRNEIEYILQDFKVCIEPEKLDRDHTADFQTYSPDADKTSFIRLISGKDCCPETAFQEFMATKNSFKKADQTMFYHYDQAFKDGETVSPKTAHEIAVKFAEDNYPDYEVVIATHVDNEHLHSHFIINSVSFRTGKKLHEGPKTLQKLRAYSDQICQQYGLTTLEPYTGGRSQSLPSREYRAAAKGQSWKFALMNAIDTAMRRSATKQEFIQNMERQGYAVRWEDSRRSITYTCPNGKPCRDFKLHDNRYLKEMMEREFELRRIEAAQRRLAASRADVPAFANDRVLSHDGNRSGQSVFQSGVDLEWDGGSAAPAHVPAAAEQQPIQTDEQPPHAGAAGADQHESNSDAANACTGWEAEREILFSEEVQAPAPGMVGGAGLPAVGFDGIAPDLIRLGKSVEQLDAPTPVKDSTTRKPAHERKKGLGQKKDDHSGYDFEMKM